MYTHERQDWPQLTWNRERLAEPLAAIRHRQGRLIGYMGALGFKLRQEASGSRTSKILHCAPPRHRYRRPQARRPQC